MEENKWASYFMSPNSKIESSKNKPLRFPPPAKVGEKRGNMGSLPNMTTNNHYEKLLMPTPSSKLPSFGAFINVPSEPKEDLTAVPFKRYKGRPRGSKNKLRSSFVIEEEPDNIMKWVVIKIPTGHDVVESLINVALHHQANITVLGGVGLVSDVTVHNSVSQAPAFTILGSSQMISISGTYFNKNYGEVIIEPFYSSFSIFLAGDCGKVFGGIIVGKVKAACDIFITAVLSKKSEFYKGDAINESIPKVEEDGVSINVDHVELEQTNTHFISGYGVMGANQQILGPPPGYEDVIPCNHCTHTNNY